MKDKTINKANNNFANMTKEQKDDVVDTITTAAYSVAFKTDTWKRIKTHKANNNLGYLHRFYSILSRLTEQEVEQFITAYVEPL